MSLVSGLKTGLKTGLKKWAVAGATAALTVTGLTATAGTAHAAAPAVRPTSAGSTPATPT